MNQQSQQPCERRVGRRLLLMAGIALGIVALALVIVLGKSLLGWDVRETGRSSARTTAGNVRSNP